MSLPQPLRGPYPPVLVLPPPPREPLTALALPSAACAPWGMALIQVVSDTEPGERGNCHPCLLPPWQALIVVWWAASAPSSLPLPSGASGHISHPLDWGFCLRAKAVHWLLCIRKSLFHTDILSDPLFFSLCCLKIDASPPRGYSRAACMNW